MNKIIVRGGVVIAILAVLLSVFWWRTLLWMGQLEGVRAHFDGQCSIAAPIIGSEDLVIDRTNRLVYISSYDRKTPDTSGSIWVMPADSPGQAVPLDILGMDGTKFKPHGLDLFIDTNKNRYLFVIDHGSRPVEKVRKFLISENQLLLQNTYESAEFYSPNDIAAIGDNQFYITNDRREKLGSIAEFFGILFRKKTGNVVWFSNSKAKTVASGFSYANGIAVSNDAKQLFVTATVDQNLRIFDRNPQSGDLTLVDSVFLGSGLDNIDINEDGSLWIAAHPRLMDFSAHAKNPEKRSPSQVFRVDVQKKSIQEIYASEGDPLSGASVAAQLDNKIFMGSVFDPAVMACEQKQEKK